MFTFKSTWSEFEVGRSFTSSIVHVEAFQCLEFSISNSSVEDFHGAQIVSRHLEDLWTLPSPIAFLSCPRLIFILISPVNNPDLS